MNWAYFSYACGITLCFMIPLCTQRFVRKALAPRSAQATSPLNEDAKRAGQESSTGLIRAAMLHLQASYPEHIMAISSEDITWADGTRMPTHERELPEGTTLENPSLIDQLTYDRYPAVLEGYVPVSDPGRIRYEPFFKKMYGDSQSAVEKNLVYVSWLPRIFDSSYKVRMTTINGVAQKIEQISHELEKLVEEYPEFKEFLAAPAGSYYWRKVANTDRLSPHSFGIALDLNVGRSHYWQWDLKNEGKLVSEDTPLTYRNEIPLAIVRIFEKYGFIWGGAWYHYDTMHFEYRPELLT